MGTYRLSKVKSITLTKAQETFLDALDIEVSDAGDVHSITRSFECQLFELRTAKALVNKGIVTMVGDRDNLGNFEVSLTQLGIDLIAAIETKASIAFEKKLAG
jgi:hypothetical protein